ncbi:hypothetical protein CS062_16370 [Roseateles chitinivorans]|uniref:Uncharacterized protein n=1 Tax=Roseateles chitinivorans TaxID=2917965 RepID=A0A2G9C6W9_9BURK|nr:hypothetical protein [Roseateles chitinivorans]PIM52127.1 hypothetical protein CS062_16370 [Roseateles chitinivorans]
MALELDLRKAHFSRVHGDIVAVQTWVNDTRALVLIPALRKDAGWYIVEESAAYLWNINAIDGGERDQALKHANRQAYIACEILRIEPSMRNRARLITIITDTLPDLLRMPSAPESEFIKAAVGEMKLMADGRQIAGQDIRLEKEGATYA